jgi:hypothetical protein
VKRLTDRDTADHLFLLTLAVRFGPPVMLILGGIEFYFWRNRFVWFVIPDLAATALIILGASRLMGGASRAAGGILFPSGRGTPAPREYSEIEALIVRGRFVEAADSYRAILDDEPANNDVRMRLGRLLDAHCGDPAAAEAPYLEARRVDRTAQLDWLTSNALIDLYERIGPRERLKQELARLSRRFENTETGANARRRWQELLDEETPPAR